MNVIRARAYNENCKRCPRLAKHLKQIKTTNPDYFCKPVPSYGDDEAKLLIVGLAPGLKGANRTGFPFTGDASGEWLYRALFQNGFADTEDASGLVAPTLKKCRITNAVKCLPPGNSPTTEEVNNCLGMLKAEVSTLKKEVLLALGSVAHKAILKTLNLRLADYPFYHGAVYALPNDITLVSSYHCSKYNTQTKRLTWPMFDEVFQSLKDRCEL